MKTNSKFNGKFIDLKNLENFSKKLKNEGKKIVFTTGNWDMFHVGHMRFLNEAKKAGDILFVGVNSNKFIKKIKGPGKPILDELVRCEALTFLTSVDFVILNPDNGCLPILQVLKPDTFVIVDEDWQKEFKGSKEYKEICKYGGKVKLIERKSPYLTTTSIVERVVGAQVGDLFKKYMKVRKSPLKQ